MSTRYCTLLLLLGLSACGQKAAPPETASDQPEISNVLVTVNGEDISEHDLEAAIVRTLGTYASYQLDDTGRQKLLESIVLSKAMAITQQSKMSQGEIAEFNVMVSAYKDELLAKRYLQENVNALPVSNKMVESYYQNNLEKFGKKTIKTFEVIKGLTKVKGVAYQKQIKEMAAFSKRPNWQELAEQLQNQGYQIEHSKGAVQAGVLTSEIDSIIKSLSVNQESELSIVDEQPLMVRIISEKLVPAKPLKAVSHEIKKSLAPLQLKVAVKKEAEKILQQVNVVYLNQSAQ